MIMSLNLQPALPSSPIDGAPASSRDGGTLQTPSFGEVLKVEEKKLQQEQEVNALSIASLFAKIQPPMLTETISGFDVNAEVIADEENASTALTTDSAQAISSSPQQFAPQVSTPDVEASASVKSFETSKDIEQAVTEKATTPQLKPQAVAADKSKNSTTKIISSNPDSQIVASATKAEFVQNVSRSEPKPKNPTRTTKPVSEVPQPVRATIVLTKEQTKTMLVAFEQVASNVTPIEVESGKPVHAESSSASLIQEQFRTAPATSEQTAHDKSQVVESDQTKETPVDFSIKSTQAQPVTIATHSAFPLDEQSVDTAITFPIATPVSAEIETPKEKEAQLIDKPLPSMTKTTDLEQKDPTVTLQVKRTLPARTDVAVDKVPQSTIKTVAPAMRDGKGNVENKTPSRVKANTFVDETAQPTADRQSPVIKPAAPEINNEPFLTRVKMTVLPIAENPTREVTSPAVETVIPLVQPASSETLPIKAVTVEGHVGELSQVEEDVTVSSTKTVEIDFNSKPVVLKEKPVAMFSTTMQPTESKTDEQTFEEVKNTPSVKHTVPANKAAFSTDTVEKSTLDGKPEESTVKIFTVAQVENLVDETPELELRTSVSNGFAQVESNVEKVEVETPQSKKETVVQTVKVAISREAPRAEVNPVPGINIKNDKIVFDTIYKPVKAEESIPEDVLSTKETPVPTITVAVSHEAPRTEPDPSLNAQSNKLIFDAIYEPVKAAESITEAILPAKESPAPTVITAVRSKAPKTEIEPSINTQSDKLIFETIYKPVKAAESITKDVLPTKDTPVPTITFAASHEAPKTEAEPGVNVQSAEIVFDTIYTPETVNIPEAKVSLNSKAAVSNEMPKAGVVATVNLLHDDIVPETAPVKKELPIVGSSLAAKDVVTANARVFIGDQTPKTETISTVNLPNEKTIIEIAALLTSLPAKEATQTESEVVVSEAKAVLSDNAMTPESELTTPVREEIPINDVLQPVKEPGEQTVSTELFIDESGWVSSEQVDASVRQSSQPVKANSSTAAKVDDQLNVGSEIGESLKIPVAETKEVKGQPSHATEREMVQQPTIFATDKFAPAPGNREQQFVEKTNEPISPSMIAAHDVKVNISEIAQPVAVKSVAQVDEVVLKDEDDKVSALLGEENVTAESRLGVVNRPKVKNEAPVVEQKNAPVKIHSEVQSQSVRAEIDPNEKTTSKDTERKPGVDLEATGIAAELNRGAANVKAAEKSPVKQTDPKTMDVVGQITSQMKTHIKSGETSIHMKLNPEELGAIEVQVTRNTQGVSVSFIAEQSSTGQLLEAQAGELRQSLKDAGVQLTNLNIGQHHQPNQEGGGFRQSQQFVQTSQRDVPHIKADEEIQTKQVGLISEIDYLV